MVCPSRCSSPSTSHSARRLCGSRPAVGSSRNSVAGRCMIARATISRCAIPPDSADDRLGPAVGEPELLEPCAWPRSSRCVRSSRRSARGSRGSPRRVSDRSSVFVCGTTPITCFAATGCATTSMPPTNAPPLVGITRVVSMPAVVVLPGAVRTEQPEDLAAAHREVEPVDGADRRPDRPWSAPRCG